MKRVSIIIPVYNLQEYLNECLNSVLSQTYKNLEIIVIDDGSQDTSLQICQMYAEKDVRIRVFSQKNKGVSSARNKGIENVTGDYLMFVDGDDFLEPFFIEHYVNTMEKYNVDIVIGGITFLTSDGKREENVPSKQGAYKKEIWNIICKEKTGLFGYVPNKLYRTELIKKNRIIFCETMRSQEDLDFALSAYSVGNSFFLIDEVGYVYRYCTGKRLHPLLQYIRNQLKMWELAKMQCSLCYEAELAVIERIHNLIFTYLYYLPVDSMFIEKCKKIETESGIEDCIRAYPGTGETWIISKLLLQRKYEVLKKYFCVRHALRRIFCRQSIV